jgi:NADPH-dependent curcumin reductase CurA
MSEIAREVRLVARPNGFPEEGLFEVAETPVPRPSEGQVLIRNAYFSVDPYMRPRMNDVRSYVPPFTLGQPMTGGAVGRVVASRNSRYQ